VLSGEAVYNENDPAKEETMPTAPTDPFKVLQCRMEEIVPALETAAQHGYHLIGMSQDQDISTLVFEREPAQPSDPGTG
jgi:hypothetical protein